MKKLYRIELKAWVVIAADSLNGALEFAEDMSVQKKIVNEWPLGVHNVKQIISEADLPPAWDSDLTPYGDEDNDDPISGYLNK